VANLSKTLHINFYQNRSTFAEVTHKSILVCFLCPLGQKKTHQNTFARNFNKCSQILVEIGVQCLG